MDARRPCSQEVPNMVKTTPTLVWQMPKRSQNIGPCVDTQSDSNRRFGQVQDGWQVRTTSLDYVGLSAWSASQ